ncbi:MAG: hypothetical protein SGCHY_000996 [Lobulomycetales sp.]
MPERFQMPKREYVPNPNKLDGMSTNAQDFKNFPIQKRVAGGPHKNNLNTGEGKFEGASDYQNQFKQHVIPEKFQMAKREYVPNPNKLDGVSTNAQDYKNFPIQKRVPGGPLKNNLNTMKNPFAGDSEYDDQFIRRSIPERFRVAKREYVPNPDKFTGVSTARADFIAFAQTGKRVIGGPHKNNLQVGEVLIPGPEDRYAGPRVC